VISKLEKSTKYNKQNSRTKLARKLLMPFS
jgi:hypothetical protein